VFRLGWYYSTRDWTHPDYLQGDNHVYNAYYEAQVKELLTEYGPVDVLWFDHCFAWTIERAEALTGGAVECRQTSGGVDLTFSKEARDPVVTLVKLTLDLPAVSP